MLNPAYLRVTLRVTGTPPGHHDEVSLSLDLPGGTAQSAYRFRLTLAEAERTAWALIDAVTVQRELAESQAALPVYNPDRPSEAAADGLIALDRACESFVNQNGLADALGIRSPSISGWRKTGKVPTERCVDIERVTLGKVTRYDLRPDVFGDAPRTDLAEAG